MSLLYVVIDDCPVPRRIARKIKRLKRDVPGAVLLSCYRGERAKGLLHRLGKHTQRELYDAWKANPHEFAPANRPGRSSHELRSDAGGPLPSWAVGQDWTDDHVDQLIHAAARHGWLLWRQYPAGSERHHVAFKRRP